MKITIEKSLRQTIKHQNIWDSRKDINNIPFYICAPLVFCLHRVTIEVSKLNCCVSKQ